MVSSQEFKARLADSFTFDKAEILGLISTALVTGFIFSFRDWGLDAFDLIYGLRNLITTIFLAALCFAVHISAQKLAAISQGYRAIFKVWYLGLAIMLIVAFVTFGYFPLIIAGGITLAFMERQRIGEKRYGFNFKDNGAITSTGIHANMALATLFAILNLVFPSTLFIKAIILNVLLSLFSLIPLPQLDGPAIFFGSRNNFFFLLLYIVLGGLLLYTSFKAAIILMVILQAGFAIFKLLTTSEK